jgi:hypothetical protein
VAAGQCIDDVGRVASAEGIVPVLTEQEVYLALFHGVRRVAADCAGQAPRRERAALASSHEFPVLKRWLQNWTTVRHRDAAERTVLTAIEGAASPATLADLMVAAGTERAFADGGHVLDFINKAFECLDLIGFDHAAELLPSLMPVLTAGQGAEESTAWRSPLDLITLRDQGSLKLAGLFIEEPARSWSDHAALAEALLAGDPLVIISALETAVLAGASPADLGRSLAYAAALRVARFGNANEHGDWEQPITSSPTPMPSTNS